MDGGAHFAGTEVQMRAKKASRLEVAGFAVRGTPCGLFFTTCHSDDLTAAWVGAETSQRYGVAQRPHSGAPVNAMDSIHPADQPARHQFDKLN
eukprot:361207-Chlamydomonas_euryale.AAC.9